MPLFQVESLSFRYIGQERYAVEDINLTIDEGEFVLLVGPSGCGKSTLARCLNGLIPHFYEGELKGEVRVGGVQVRSTPTYVLSQTVGMVFQNPQNQLFSLTVENDVAFALENLGLPRQEIRERVDEAMQLIGISDLKDRSPFELSGGQQQKVAIASVLAMRPKAIVMDEPTSFLDPLSAANLLLVIEKARQQLGLTVILIDHRIDLAAPKATRLVVMRSGRLAYDGQPGEFFERPDAHTYGVYVPRVVRLAQEVNRRTRVFDRMPISPEEFERMVRLNASSRVH